MDLLKGVRRLGNIFKKKSSATNKERLVRNGSVRGSSKSIRLNQGVTKPAAQPATSYSGCAALVIVNSKYKPNEWDPLNGVLEDGKNMEEMLNNCGYEVEVAKDVEDILKEVENFCQKHKNKKRVHFHYSGHGVHNANVEVDGVERNWRKMTHTYRTATPTRDCMVSTSGVLISVHDIKHILLKSNPEKATIILDMCRDLRRDNRGRNKDFVKLRNEEEISLADHKKIAVIYGTCDLHTAMDNTSFTRELYTLVKDNGWYLPILDITRKVNKYWEDNGIQQLCSESIVQVGDNWEIYKWPATPKLSKKGGNATKPAIGSQLVDVTNTTSIMQPIEKNPQADQSMEQQIVQLLERQSKGDQEVQKLKDDVSTLKKRRLALHPEENNDLKAKVAFIQPEVLGTQKRKLLRSPSRRYQPPARRNHEFHNSMRYPESRV